MKVKAMVGRRWPKREGISQRTGKQYVMRDIIVFWDEQGLNSTARHDVKATCMQDLNEERLNSAASTMELVDVDLSFSSVESKKTPDSYFTDIKVWFPKEFINVNDEK